MDIEQVRTQFLRPALAVLGLKEPRREDFMLGIGHAESKYQYVRQLPRTPGGPFGPALSWWQIEPATESDTWDNYLRFRPELASKVNTLRGPGERGTLDLVKYPQYAAAIAALKILRSPNRLPRTPEEAAVEHKVTYNSALGGADPNKSLASFKLTWRN